VLDPELVPADAGREDGAADIDAVAIDDERQGFAELYERLRRDVLSGKLVPGTVVSQVQIARRYSVSRAPLREALRMLQSEGLVEAQPGRRNRISEVSAPDLEQLYALRITVEALAVRLSVKRMTDEDVAGLRWRLSEMDALAETRDFDRWEVPHRAFHQALVAGSGERLVSTINELSDHAERYRRMLLSQPRAWSAASSEHAEIVSACEARDADLAAARLAAHFATSALTVCAGLAPEYEPAGVRESLRMVRQASGVA
jgi:DNA-binding GntR family transcriptional regulator